MSEPRRFTHTEMVMGTAFCFDVRLPEENDASSPSPLEVVSACGQWLHRANSIFTTYEPSSWVSRLGRGEVDAADGPPELADVIGLCHRLKGTTKGWFDPWGGPEHSFDPSGLVKGWAAQHVSEMLTAAGFIRHCINAGGDVVARGRPAGRKGWGVGVIHPLRRHGLCAVIEVCNESVATSGTAERGHHIWRPDGAAASQLACVTVVHPDMVIADVYATAAFAMGPEAPLWLETVGTDALVVYPDGRQWSSPGFARRRTWPLEH